MTASVLTERDPCVGKQAQGDIVYGTVLVARGDGTEVLKSVGETLAKAPGALRLRSERGAPRAVRHERGVR